MPRNCARRWGSTHDPYRDFGRLQLELHRAIRLVVDSGIHHKRWSREQAIKYVEDNSADAKGGIVKAIERYIVYPGQATAYMVGKLKIEELRAKAEAALGAEVRHQGLPRHRAAGGLDAARHARNAGRRVDGAGAGELTSSRRRPGSQAAEATAADPRRDSRHRVRGDG